MQPQIRERPLPPKAPPPFYSDVEYNDDNNCIICYEEMSDFTSVRLECGHRFHSEVCLQVMFVCCTPSFSFSEAAKVCLERAMILGAKTSEILFDPNLIFWYWYGLCNKQHRFSFGPSWSGTSLRWKNSKQEEMPCQITCFPKHNWPTLCLITCMHGHFS